MMCQGAQTPLAMATLAWHDWRGAVEGRAVALAIDARAVGQIQSSKALLRALGGQPMHVGFSTHDTWIEVAHVRVTVATTPGIAARGG